MCDQMDEVGDCGRRPHQMRSHDRLMQAVNVWKLASGSDLPGGNGNHSDGIAGEASFAQTLLGRAARLGRKGMGGFTHLWHIGMRMLKILTALAGAGRRFMHGP